MNAESKAVYTPEYTGVPLCLICGHPLSLKLARGRKSGKPFVLLVCAKDGRHFRAFISHQPYVREVLARLEASREAEAENRP